MWSLCTHYAFIRRSPSAHQALISCSLCVLPSPILTRCSQDAYFVKSYSYSSPYKISLVPHLILITCLPATSIVTFKVVTLPSHYTQNMLIYRSQGVSLCNMVITFRSLIAHQVLTRRPPVSPGAQLCGLLPPYPLVY